MNWLAKNMKLIFFCLGVAIIIILAAPVWATDECRGHSCNDPTTVVNADSNVSTAVRHSSRSFGLSGGDVDISQCYRSYTYFVVWQDTKVNKLCVAIQQAAEGNFEAAARSRCSVRAIVNDYDSFAQCVALNTVKLVPPVVIEEPNYEEEEEAEAEYRQEQMQMQQDYDERIAQLEQRVSRPRVTREIIQQPFLSDEKRAKLQAVLDE